MARVIKYPFMHALMHPSSKWSSFWKNCKMRSVVESFLVRVRPWASSMHGNAMETAMCPKSWAPVWVLPVWDATEGALLLLPSSNSKTEDCWLVGMLGGSCNVQAVRVAVQPLNPSCPTLSPQDPSQADSGVVFKESCLWIVGPETRNKEEDVELSPQGHHWLGLPLGLSGKTKLLPLQPPSLPLCTLPGGKKAKERETQDLELNLGVCSPNHPVSTCLHVVYRAFFSSVSFALTGCVPSKSSSVWRSRPHSG